MEPSSDITINDDNELCKDFSSDSPFPYKLQKVHFLTRIIEIILALAGLILVMPIMLIIALIIRLDTPGNVLFRQNRMGIGAKPFRFIKFRTLYADAKERFPELYAYKYSPEQLDKLCFKIKDDPRITPQGKWLRNSTLDELPNFWCLLKGDLAIVGPRPEIPEMLPYYKGEMLKKFSVRPGITGLAQVSGRGNLCFYDTVKYDLEYVENKSLLLDLKIVFLTIKGVILRDGAF